MAGVALRARGTILRARLALRYRFFLLSSNLVTRAVWSRYVADRIFSLGQDPRLRNRRHQKRRPMFVSPLTHFNFFTVYTKRHGVIRIPSYGKARIYQSFFAFGFENVTSECRNKKYENNSTCTGLPIFIVFLFIDIPEVHRNFCFATKHFDENSVG